jgi:predicted outer membrane repeat protein
MQTGVHLWLIQDCCAHFACVLPLAFAAGTTFTANQAALGGALYGDRMNALLVDGASQPHDQVPVFEFRAGRATATCGCCSLAASLVLLSIVMV